MRVLTIQNIAGIAGSEKYFVALLPALAAKGVHCEFINVYKKKDKAIAQEFSQMLEEEGIKVHEIPITTYASIPLLFKINSIYKKGKFDCIHAHLIYSDFWCSAIKKYINRKMVVFSTKHGYQHKYYVDYCMKPEQLPKTLYYRLFRFAHKTMDRTYSCSYGLQEFYTRAGLIKKDEIDVIQHGFDYPEPDFDNLSQYKFSEHQLIIAGRLVKRKGQHFVIEILPNLIKKFPKIKLLLLGTGVYESEFRRLVKEKSLENHVDFMGYKTNVVDYMAASDIVLVPSYAEGLPLVLMEAFASKSPAIAFDVIGCGEAIVDNETGYSLPPFDLEMLEEKITYLLKNPDERNRLAENAHDKLKSYFCLDRMTDDTIAFYKKYLS